MSYLPTSGSCCAPCASGGACTDLGATKAVTRNLVNRATSVSILAQGQETKIGSRKMLIVGVLAGTAALGALYLARRKR